MSATAVTWSAVNSKGSLARSFLRSRSFSFGLTTALAARFQFNNLDVRNAVEASATAVISGTSPEQAAAAAQKIVDERL